MRCGFFDIVVKDASKPAVSCAYYYKKSISLFSWLYEGSYEMWIFLMVVKDASKPLVSFAYYYKKIIFHPIYIL